MQQEAAGVQAVALPDGPGVGVAGFVTEAEPGRPEPLAGHINHQGAPIACERLEQRAEGFAELGGREGQRVLAGVVVVHPSHGVLGGVQLHGQGGEQVAVGFGLRGE